jgi:hypothetical protein
MATNFRINASLNKTRNSNLAEFHEAPAREEFEVNGRSFNTPNLNHQFDQYAAFFNLLRGPGGTSSFMLSRPCSNPISRLLFDSSITPQKY